MDKDSQYVSQRGNLYNRKRWAVRRKQQLMEHPLCVMCEHLGKYTPATVADHIVPHRGDYRLFFEGELQSLCKVHHDSSKQRQERSGVIVGGLVDGMPIDPNHHWNTDGAVIK